MDDVYGRWFVGGFWWMTSLVWVRARAWFFLYIPVILLNMTIMFTNKSV